MTPGIISGEKYPNETENILIYKNSFYIYIFIFVMDFSRILYHLKFSSQTIKYTEESEY